MILARREGIITSCQQRAGNARFTLVEVNRRANPSVQTSFPSTRDQFQNNNRD